MKELVKAGRMNHFVRIRTPLRMALGMGLGILVLGVTGCSSTGKQQAKVQINVLQGQSGRTAAITPTQLQAEVMRFADDYAQVVEQAADDFAGRVGTSEAQILAARIKFHQANAAFISASGPNPLVNLLDVIVLATVSRMVAQDYLVADTFGAAAVPVLEVTRQLESNAWSIAETVLTIEQQQELRGIIRTWREQNPHQRYVGSIRFREFATAIGQVPKAGKYRPTSVFSMLFLDPMAGLDPTIRAVEETRYLAERIVYYGQRLPLLVGWQSEHIALRLADQPAAQQVLTNLTRVAGSMQVFSETARELPQLIDDQREAAITQVFDRVAQERSNIVATLVAEESRVRGVLADSRQALAEAQAAATAVDGAIQSLDAFLHFVKPPKTNQAVVSKSPPGRPFDILDYGTAASEIGDAAKDLNLLLTSVNESTPQVALVGKQTAADLQQVIQHGFRLALILIVVLLLGAVLAGLAYRALSARMGR